MHVIAYTDHAGAEGYCSLAHQRLSNDYAFCLLTAHPDNPGPILVSCISTIATAVRETLDVPAAELGFFVHTSSQPGARIFRRVEFQHFEDDEYSDPWFGPVENQSVIRLLDSMLPDTLRLADTSADAEFIEREIASAARTLEHWFTICRKQISTIPPELIPAVRVRLGRPIWPEDLAETDAA